MLTQQQEALKWYGERARAVHEYLEQKLLERSGQGTLHSNESDVLRSVLIELALDNGALARRGLENETANRRTE